MKGFAGQREGGRGVEGCCWGCDGEGDWEDGGGDGYRVCVTCCECEGWDAEGGACCRDGVGDAVHCDDGAGWEGRGKF